MRAVLTYHSIDETGSTISVTPSQFRRHVQWLASSKVSVRSLPNLVGSCVNPSVDGSDATDAVALTFDDGFMNFADHAMPLLRDHGMSATVFVVSDHVGRDNRWSGSEHARVPILPLMDWDALGEISEAGVEIGAHTRTHPHLPAVSDAQLEDEMLGSAEVIGGRLGRRPVSFAYPFGASDERVVSHARQAFSITCSTEFRALRSSEDSARIPRLDAWYFRRAGGLESYGSPAFRLRVALRHQLRQARRHITPD